MPRYFVSRHPGAIHWARQQGLAVDAFVPHLDATTVQAGDVVMGTLPVALAAQVCERGAQYLHLSLHLPQDLRGTELSADQLHHLQAELTPYHVVQCPAATMAV